MKKKSLHFFALGSLGQGLSGGDRIYIELARRFARNHKVLIYVWEEGLAMCQRQHLKGSFLQFRLIKVGALSKLGFVLTYLYRIFLGVKLGLTLKINSGEYVYSASEFWMDSLPAFILKQRFPKTKWVAAWYQTAPNPVLGFWGGRSRLRALAYWLVQLPIKPLIDHFADFVLINNESERQQFPRLNKLNRTIVVLGAVNISAINSYIFKHKLSVKKYDAVFQGRFHPQKGVVELVEIWKRVCDKNPKARLVMIGDGPLMTDVQRKIRELRLGKSIDILGYVYDGSQKYKIFSQSKIVVHPAFYDSGGMASAEAMAFGLPVVGFDLPAYESYYPVGMYKVAVGNLSEFAGAVLLLLGNKKLYKKLAHQAKTMVDKNWSWDDRATQVFTSITS